MSEEQDDWLRGLGVAFDKVMAKADEANAAVTGTLQSAQASALGAIGASPDTIAQVKAGEQALADFDQGRQQGLASGSIGLLSALAPVQLFTAGSRIAGSDDPVQEAMNIANEKANTVARIANAVTDPVGTGEALGQSLAKDLLQAKKEGRLANETGNLVGHGEVIAVTVAVTAGAGGAAAAGEVGAAGAGDVALSGAGELGTGAGEGLGGAGEGLGDGAFAGAPKTSVPEFAPGEGPPTLRSPGPEPFDPAPSANPQVSPLADSIPEPPIPATEPGAPPTLRTPGPEPFDPAPSANPQVSPLADSIPEPPIPATEPGAPPTLRTPGPEPFDPAPSANPQVSPLADSIPEPPIPATEPGAPPTLRTPGPEPFDPAPSVEDPTPSTERSPPTVPTEPPTFRTGDVPPPESAPETVPESAPATQPFPPAETAPPE